MSDAKRKRAFSFSPLRKLMKKAGANIVSRTAVDELLRNLETKATELTKLALKFSNHAKRKKISKEDMLLAIKYSK